MTKTGKDGRFFFPLPYGKWTLLTSRIGYLQSKKEIEVIPTGNPFLQLELDQSLSKLNEVLVSASRKGHLE